MHRMTETRATEQTRTAAQNQSLFREINERIRWAGGSAPVRILCECAIDGCDETIAMSIDDYNAVRTVGTQFVVSPSHVDGERVVLACDQYAVVQATGEAARIAGGLDPRGRSAGNGAVVAF